MRARLEGPTGESWAGPAARPGGRSRPAFRPFPAPFPPSGMRFPPHPRPVYSDIRPLARPRPLQGWACPCPRPAGSPRPGEATWAWGGVLLPSNFLFQARVSFPHFPDEKQQSPETLGLPSPYPWGPPILVAGERILRPRPSLGEVRMGGPPPHPHHFLPGEAVAGAGGKWGRHGEREVVQGSGLRFGGGSPRPHAREGPG